MPSPETLETYAKIFEMRRRYFDNGKWYWIDPSDIELTAAAALRFWAASAKSR